MTDRVVPLPCSECGDFVLVPRSDLSDDEAKMASTGRAKTLCINCKPRAVEPEEHAYRVEIRIKRDDTDELMMLAGNVSAKNITKAWPDLTTAISQQWEKAQSMAAFAEQDLP